MNALPATERFLASLTADGRSPHTVAAYRRDLAVFTAFVGNVPLDSVTPGLLQQFMAHHGVLVGASGAPRAKATINRYRVTVKALFAWAEARWLITRNPTAILRCQRQRGLPPVVLTDAEITQLVGAEFPGTTGRRDHALVAFMLLTGCRLAETAALDVADLGLDRRVVLLRKTKGGDPDRVLLSPRLAAILTAHVAMLRRSGGALFACGQRRLSTRQIQRIVTRRVLGAGIQKSVTAHTLRHSFATALYNRTGDIRLVQQALRHTHVTTTEIYAQVDPKRWRREIAAIA